MIGNLRFLVECIVISVMLFLVFVLLILVINDKFVKKLINDCFFNGVFFL